MGIELSKLPVDRRVTEDLFNCQIRQDRPLLLAVDAKHGPIGPRDPLDPLPPPEAHGELAEQRGPWLGFLMS